MLSSGKNDPKDPPSKPLAEKLILVIPSSALVVATHLNQNNGVSITDVLSSNITGTHQELHTPQSPDSFLEESKSAVKETTRLSKNESMESISQSELALSIADISVNVLPNKVDLPDETAETTDDQSSPSKMGPWSRHGQKYLASKPS